MDKNLVFKLLERNILTKETEVDFWYKGRHIDGLQRIKVVGTFTVLDYTQDNSGAWFKVQSIVDGTELVLHSSQIVGIEGMKPERFIQPYNLTKKGNYQKYKENKKDMVK